ncbi:MAG: hypothetical protein HY962_12595 [Ignavibacteriae bacterium]|nr:hypothetical protein [Ignavibacteriota bacterium]
MPQKKPSSPWGSDAISRILAKCFEDPTFFERLLKSVPSAVKKEKMTFTPDELAVVSAEVAGLGDEGISTMRFMFSLTKLSKNLLAGIGVKGPIPPWSQPDTLKKWMRGLGDAHPPRPGLPKGPNPPTKPPKTP